MSLDPGVRRDPRYGAAPPASGGGPSRRTVILSLLGSAAAAAVTGSVIGLLRPGPAAVTTTAASGTASRSAAATAGASATAAARSASPSASPSPSVRPTPSPLPANAIGEPWKDKRNDFVTVKGLKRDGEYVALRVDRLTFLIGDAAQKYYDQNPDQERQDFAIVNQSQKQFTYTLVNDVPIFGSQLLAGQVDLRQISLEEFTSRVDDLLDDKTPLYLWLRHEDGGKGWTTYVAEQYLP